MRCSPYCGRRCKGQVLTSVKSTGVDQSRFRRHGRAEISRLTTLRIVKKKVVSRRPDRGRGSPTSGRHCGLVVFPEYARHDLTALIATAGGGPAEGDWGDGRGPFADG